MAESGELHLCLVEDHCDVVPFLAACYRAKLIPAGGAELVHVDAHPDLSAPSPPAATEDFRRIERLMEVLAGEGGIAEFVLPLVHLGLLSSVEWVRSPWSRQFGDGDYSFLVGDVRRPPGLPPRVGVSLRHPYYLDDRAHVEEESLINSRPVLLRVTDGQVAPPPSDRPWVLDICLDYFSTCNPFLDELLRRTGGSAEDVRTVSSFLEETSGSGSSLEELLKASEALTTDGDPAAPGQLLKAVRGMSQDTRDYIAEVGHLLLLPHHRASDDEMRSLLSRLVGFLRTSRPSPPVAVTVARSAVDGFTFDVERCQEMVLGAIREQLLPLWSSALGRDIQLVTHDMCEDAEAKCSALLLRTPRNCESFRRKRKFLEDCGVISW